MRHVIWDMGGTLIDTYPEVNQTLTRAVNGDEATYREVCALTRVSIAHAIKTLAARYGVASEVLTASYRKLKQHWRTHPAPLMAGARELIDAVRTAGYLNIVITHRDRTSATHLLHALHLDIDAMICASDGYPRKPDPAMFIVALSHCDITADTTLAVGDRRIDALAASAAQIDNYLLTPTAPDSHLPARTRVISDLGELAAALR